MQRHQQISKREALIAASKRTCLDFCCVCRQWLAAEILCAASSSMASAEELQEALLGFLTESQKTVFSGLLPIMER